MNKIDRQRALYDWITEQHHDQERKDGEYYPNHLYRVADMARPYGDLCYEIGLCHDLLEDTPNTAKDLWNKLDSLGYSTNETSHIVRAVHHLSSVYSSDNYPWLSRDERKALEQERLAAVKMDDAVTVKYCDIYDNLRTVHLLEPSFRAVYLPEKTAVLEGLQGGHPEMRKRVEEMLREQLGKSS